MCNMMYASAGHAPERGGALRFICVRSSDVIGGSVASSRSADAAPSDTDRAELIDDSSAMVKLCLGCEL